MSNNVSNASVKSNPSEITDNSSQKAADTEMTSVATPSESNDVALDVDAIDIDALLDIADAVDVTWVREQHQLVEVINALATCGRVALDTEFIKRDTYYPRLALVQLNTGNHVYLLDAPELQLSELWDALRKVDVAIWHACGEDLGLFYLLSGCPQLTNIFDTHIALSYFTGPLHLCSQQALTYQLY
ncbi:ribonuclease D, partial [Psychrobacter sp. 1Y4]